MNDQNYGYLKDTLKYLGFGESLSQQLADRMKEGAKEFVLGHSAQFGENRIDASLFFRRSDQSDLYFLNKWIGTVGEYEAARSQSFYVNKGHGITLKEGFNLLEGRAVHKELTDKEGQTYKAWLQLDGKEKDPAGNYKVNQYHERYGFDLERKLETLPIKQLADGDQKANLMRSLEKGNLQAVTFEKSGHSDQLLIAANPRYKAIAVFDQTGKQIPQHSLEKKYALMHNAPEVSIIGKVATKSSIQQKQQSGTNQEQKTSVDKSKREKLGTPAGKGLQKLRTGKPNRGMHS